MEGGQQQHANRHNDCGCEREKYQLDHTLAVLSAVLPSDQPPQLKPTIIVATGPAAAPCSRHFSGSP